MSPTPKQIDIFEEVLHERAIQDLRFGRQPANALLWLGVLGKVFGKLCQALLMSDTKKAQSKLVQLAAVAMAALEAYRTESGRNEEELAPGEDPNDPGLDAEDWETERAPNVVDFKPLAPLVDHMGDQ